MDALDEGSLTWKPQTLRTPTFGFMACANKPPLTSGSYFLTRGDPRKRELGGLVGIGKISMAFEFGPIRRSDRKLLALGKNTRGTGNRQFAGKNERGHTDFMALMCSRPKPRK